MTVKPVRYTAVNGHVNDVALPWQNSGRGEHLCISMLARSKPIFGHSRYVLTLKRPIRGSKRCRVIGTICGKRCNGRRESGPTLRSLSVILSGVQFLTFTSCHSLPRQWSERTNANLLRMWLGALGSDSRLWRRLLPDGRLRGTWQSMQASTIR